MNNHTPHADPDLAAAEKIAAEGTANARRGYEDIYSNSPMHFGSMEADNTLPNPTHIMTTKKLHQTINELAEENNLKANITEAELETMKATLKKIGNIIAECTKPFINEFAAINFPDAKASQ